MNKTQTAIVGLAVIEILLVCFFIPQLFFRVQDSELAKEVEKVSIEPAKLSFYENTIYNSSSPLTLDEKIEFANSYDSTITSILLEKGEKYSANQICSIAAGELDAICNYYEDDMLFSRIRGMEINVSLNEYGVTLGLQASDNGTEYADVDTVDETDVDLGLTYVSGSVEIRLEPYMYINSSEPEQAFIVWTVNYYDSEDGTTLFLYFDDETGRLLSVTGSLANYNDKAAYSLYPETKATMTLIKDYYDTVDKNSRESNQ
ncbi:MAG: hypothetical protein IKY04_06735 [Lachnospiraceae bacterium]|nr:hypothetical protein [Lachnospiraceae bacterium]MBR4993929.1 hypothetical protein [Lachnospiraceae bacterium]MBR5944816.1 hypothetical protein [Lachnospiraceae bacterium]